VGGGVKAVMYVSIMESGWEMELFSVRSKFSHIHAHGLQCDRLPESDHSCRLASSDDVLAQQDFVTGLSLATDL
jgi:hypothetical protein